MLNSLCSSPVSPALHLAALNVYCEAAATNAEFEKIYLSEIEWGAVDKYELQLLLKVLGTKRISYDEAWEAISEQVMAGNEIYLNASFDLMKAMSQANAFDEKRLGKAWNVISRHALKLEMQEEHLLCMLEGALLAGDDEIIPKIADRLNKAQLTQMNRCYAMCYQICKDRFPEVELPAPNSQHVGLSESMKRTKTILRNVGVDLYEHGNFLVMDNSEKCIVIGENMALNSSSGAAGELALLSILLGGKDIQVFEAKQIEAYSQQRLKMWATEKGVLA